MIHIFLEELERPRSFLEGFARAASIVAIDNINPIDIHERQIKSFLPNWRDNPTEFGKGMYAGYLSAWGY